MKKLNIYLQDIEKIWFTSDQHFGHSKIMEFCNRPFESTKAMDQALIDNWNNCVGKNDIVFTLGDFMWHTNPKKIAEVISKLNGKMIYKVMGNHDSEDMFKTIKCDRLTILSDITHLYIRTEHDKKPIEIHLSHYPLSTWSGRHRNTYNFHGHVHSRPDGDSGFDANLHYWEGYQIDVGVDAFNYKPIDLQSILYILEDRKNKEELKKVGKEPAVTRIQISDNDESLRLEFQTYLEEINDDICSVYDWTPKTLRGWVEECKEYPLHPIINMVDDHRLHIIEKCGVWCDNILSSEQYNNIRDILNKYKKEP